MIHSKGDRGMDVMVYNFPPIGEDNLTQVVEYKYCELVNRHRNGEKLDPVVLDWMDAANTWLSVKSS
jgi:hypothetical protein